MEFWASVAVLRRRWYVFVPTLLVFVLLAVYLVGEVKPTYKAEGTMVLLQTGPESNSSTASTTPTTRSDPASEAINPYAGMSPVQFAQVVSKIAGDTNFKDELVAAGGSPNYTVLPPIDGTQVLTITSTAPSAAGAMSSYLQLTTALKKAIVELQKEVNAPEATWFQGVPLNTPTAAFPETGARTKAIIVVGLLGLITAIGLSFLVDSVLAARRRNRESRVDPGDREASLIALSDLRSPLDDLADLEDPDGSAGRSTPLRPTDSSQGDQPGRRAGGLGQTSTRW